MKILYSLLLIGFASAILGAKSPEKLPCNPKPIKIGVLDTGFGFADRGHKVPLCNYGHKDFTVDKAYSTTFTSKDPIPSDTNGHGTNIVGLIDKYASQGNNSYCFVIIKYFSDKHSGVDNMAASVLSWIQVNSLKLDVVNYSGGGPNSDEIESSNVRAFLNRGGLLIAAAGNDNNMLGYFLHPYYPAMYDSRITVVGNMDNTGHRVHSSNYGPLVDTWEIGENQTALGITLTGTSQATAITTGKRVAEMKVCDK